MVRTYSIAVVVCALGVATFFVWHEVWARGHPGVLTVAFLDVGQGDALFIEAPNGSQMLIDGGVGMAVVRALGSVMPWHDRSIDVIIATHPDLDHIGGLPDVLARYDVGMVLESGVTDEGADQQAFLAAVEREGLATIPARHGMVLTLDEDVHLTILFPDTDVSRFDANTGSIVARLTYGDTSFLFTGDAPASIETYLAGRYGEYLASDVLKLGHHGSRTSTHELFVGFVSPRYGIVSASCGNSYGHPHREVLETMVRFDVTVLQTCTEGTIIFESDGKSVRRK
jgi:competence protein ComEC